MEAHNEGVRSAVIRALSAEERRGAVVYARTQLLLAGEALAVPHQVARAPWPSWLFFIDREPSANWGHSCRYVLVGIDLQDVHSIEARFPPAEPMLASAWTVTYRASDVPNRSLLILEP